MRDVLEILQRIKDEVGCDRVDVVWNGVFFRIRVQKEGQHLQRAYTRRQVQLAKFDMTEDFIKYARTELKIDLS